MSEYITLFVNGFISATILPGTSELTFLYYLSDNIQKLPAFLSVTMGNFLGAVLTFFMAWGIFSSWFDKKMPVSEARKAQLAQYGPALLLLSWVPIVGDPLVLAAGAMRLSIFWCLCWILLGKTIRYAVLLIPFV